MSFGDLFKGKENTQLKERVAQLESMLTPEMQDSIYLQEQIAAQQSALTKLQLQFADTQAKSAQQITKAQQDLNILNNQIAQAKNEAEAIIKKAQEEATELKSKTENDIKMASSQVFTAVKQQIESAIVTKTLKSVKEAAQDVEFIKTILSSIVAAFNPESSEPVALNVILPADKRNELEKFAQEKLASLCKAGLEIQFSKNIAGGFKIGPKGEGYMISFTDKDFENIIAEYLRPKTKELLFG